MLNRSNQRINYFKYLLRASFQSDFSPYYFGYGRTALKKGLKAYNIPKGKKILVPEYICSAALEPFLQEEIGIQYYCVNENLSPDWNSIAEKLTDNISAILMVHYFGFAQDIDSFIRFAQKHNLLLIEDNSHGHGGLYRNQLLGTFGDIGFSSPRKSFPLLNGGVLYIKTGNITHEKINLEPVNVFKLIIRDVVGRTLDNIKPLKELLLKKSDRSAERDEHIKEWSMDIKTFQILSSYDLNSVRKKRKEIYNIWHDWSI